MLSDDPKLHLKCKKEDVHNVQTMMSLKMIKFPDELLIIIILHILCQAWEVHQDGQLKDLFDPSFCDESQLKEMKRFLVIGLLCTEYEQHDRPTMWDVLEMLDGKKEMPAPTERIRFT